MSTTPSTSRAVRLAMALVSTIASGALISGCGAGGTTPVGNGSAATGLHAGDTTGATQDLADRAMPIAPVSQDAWLRAVAANYAHGANGTNAEAWLAARSAHTRPGQRLAVVLGVDDVVVQTHFAGLSSVVEPTVQFVRSAHQLGYAVFYVTGRSGDTGLDKVEATLSRAGILEQGVCGRPSGSANQEQGKTACRKAIVDAGYTLAMSVAASEVSFDGAYGAETEVALPDFASPY